MKAEHTLTKNAVVKREVKKLTHSGPGSEASSLCCVGVWQ